MFQLGAALLDACVLSVLQRGDTYGYQLTQNIRSVIDVSESTLYPVLRRLQKEQALTTYDSPFNGRNRRYYRIAPLGSSRLAQLQGAWIGFKAAVDDLLSETTNSGGGQA
ncbi:MAG: PadR family transcriptional regulator [Coriobacteriales bacterium]|jgi:PadR family transcriptional regulator PadR|nr:PadR family transcriptional regulator [Coriobacteriales bacterium]